MHCYVMDVFNSEQQVSWGHAAASYVKIDACVPRARTRINSHDAMHLHVLRIHTQTILHVVLPLLLGGGRIAVGAEFCDNGSPFIQRLLFCIEYIAIEGLHSCTLSCLLILAACGRCAVCLSSLQLVTDTCSA